MQIQRYEILPLVNKIHFNITKVMQSTICHFKNGHKHANKNCTFHHELMPDHVEEITGVAPNINLKINSFPGQDLSLTNL